MEGITDKPAIPHPEEQPPQPPEQTGAMGGRSASPVNPQSPPLYGDAECCVLRRMDGRELNPMDRNIQNLLQSQMKAFLQGSTPSVTTIDMALEYSIQVQNFIQRHAHPDGGWFTPLSPLLPFIKLTQSLASFHSPFKPSDGAQAAMAMTICGRKVEEILQRAVAGDPQLDIQEDPMFDGELENVVLAIDGVWTGAKCCLGLLQPPTT